MTCPDKTATVDLPLHRAAGSELRRQMRKIREQILIDTNGRSQRTVLLTGVRRGDGVSTIAANLAYEMSQPSAGSTLLVRNDDAARSDVEVPADDEAFEATIRPGPQKGLLVAAWPWARSEGFPLLLLSDLQSRYEQIIIDSPPVVEAPQVLGVVQPSDLVLLVVRAHTVKWQVVDQVKTLIEDAGAGRVGMVINRKKLYIPKLLYRRLR